ncbi:hypothetical protein B0A48_02453 [Cryoendolithus antarcticus]|uniref:Uncharacterized protein n=1 Tax=Cryoendolithus antarcticus TaxID=1507870 RepID=A0A1V8TNN6_9PEZI|nr:hypothetical protein B0A48_02453 [Cryoendolithus antarcticus]
MSTSETPLQYLETALASPQSIKWSTFSRMLLSTYLTEPDLRHVLYLATTALVKARWALRKLDLWRKRATAFGIKHADELSGETETEASALRVWRDELDLEAPAMKEGRNECVKAIESIVVKLQKDYLEVGKARELRAKWRQERG